MSIKLGHLHDQLSHSVSVSMLEEANTKYAKLVCKYQTVLQQVRMEGETDDNLSVGTRLTRVAWTNDQEGLSPGKYEIVVKGHNWNNLNNFSCLCLVILQTVYNYC